MKILIIEDDARLAALLRRGLVEVGHVVDVEIEGVSGETAALDGKYEAIVLDVMLPGRDGPTVARRLREKGIATPVLMLTARDTLDDLVSGIDALAQASEQQARIAAQSAAPGQVVSSTLDDDNGCLVYSVDSKSSDDKIHEDTVDAGNAEVLHQDIETKADGARGTNGSESENGSESGSESESGAEAGEQGGGD